MTQVASTQGYGLNRLRSWTQRHPRVLRWFRAQLVVSSLAGVAVATTGGVGYLKARELGQKVGSELMATLSPVPGAVLHVTVNGERFGVTTRLVRDGVDSVLADIESRCNRDNAALEGELRGWLEGLRKAQGGAEGRALPSTMTQRTDRQATSGRVGEVVCWMRPNPGPQPSIAERARAFLESGLLSAFGRLQYVRAERAEGAKSTTVFALWSEGDLDIGRWFPEAGDARGSDITGVPRPEAAQRLFSASVGDGEKHVVAYDSARSPERVLASYDAALPTLQWNKVLLDDEHGGESKLSRAYSKGSRALFLSLSPRGDTTGVTLIQVVADDATR